MYNFLLIFRSQELFGSDSEDESLTVNTKPNSTKEIIPDFEHNKRLENILVKSEMVRKVCFNTDNGFISKLIIDL